MYSKWWGFLVALVVAATVHAEGITVAVVDLELIGDVSPSVGQAFSEILRTQLTALDEYEVVERGQLEKILEEQQFVSDEAVNESGAAQLGKLVGAYYVITGSIVKSANEHIINLRFVNVSKGTAELAHTITIEENEGLAEACERLVHEISEKVRKKRLGIGEKIDISPPESPPVPADTTTESTDTSAIDRVVKISVAVIGVTAVLILLTL
jgi:TolB-like protein